jgi:mannose-6-phosphate isomerase
MRAVAGASSQGRTGRCAPGPGYTAGVMAMNASEATQDNTRELEPFALEPVAVERIWGTDDLSPWHPKPDAGKAIGEIWLTAENCRVLGGSADGHTLAEATQTGRALLGDPEGNGFPLLIKLLFPREKLSVQVHPNDAEAQALGMPRGKTECWYVLSAEPGAQVALGFQESLGKEQVKAAILDGSLESKLRMIPVRAGDMVFVDAGTVHAIGPGMVVLETQQYSDTTYRLWDYGRPRELHVEAGSAVTRTDTAAGLVASRPMGDFTRLAESAYFAVDRFDLAGEQPVPLGGTEHLQILIALTDGCTLQGAATLPLPRGRAVVVPAGDRSYDLAAATRDSQVVRVLQP